MVRMYGYGVSWYVMIPSVDKHKFENVDFPKAYQYGFIQQLYPGFSSSYSYYYFYSIIIFRDSNEFVLLKNITVILGSVRRGGTTSTSIGVVKTYVHPEYNYFDFSSPDLAVFEVIVFFV